MRFSCFKSLLVSDLCRDQPFFLTFLTASPLWTSSDLCNCYTNLHSPSLIFCVIFSSVVRMWQKEDPFTTPTTSPNLPYRWARANRHSRFSGFRITPIRIGIAMIFCAGLFWFHGTLHKVDAAEVCPPYKCTDGTDML